MCVYIYIYIYAGELLVCPPFGLQRVISLATLRVISLCPPFGGPFSHCENRVFEDFWDDVWSKLVFFWFPFFLQISHLSFDFLLFSNFPKPLFSKRPCLQKMQKVCFKKHYKIGFLKGVYFLKIKKWFTNCNF